MASPDPAAELIAKDQRIDDLVTRAQDLVNDLNATVADMKRILAAAQASARQQDPGAKERPGG